MDFNTKDIIIYSTLVILVILVIYLLVKQKKCNEKFDVTDNNNNAAINNLGTIAAQIMGSTGGVFTFPADVSFPGTANITGALTTTGALTADTVTTTGALTADTVTTTGNVAIAGNITLNGQIIVPKTAVQINNTSTDTTIITAVTADQVASGFISCTSMPVKYSFIDQDLQMPTGNDLGAKLNAIIGTIFDLIIDNTNGNTVVVILSNTNATVSLYSSINFLFHNTSNGAQESMFPTMIYPGAGGLSRWTFIFNSPTNYVVSRTA